MDVTSHNLVHHQRDKKSWFAVDAGFWRPTPHLVLENGFKYPDMVYLDQYIVIDEDGRVTVYRNWFQDFNQEMLVKELKEGGFEVLSLWSDLTGTPYSDDKEWIGVVAKKATQS